MVPVTPRCRSPLRPLPVPKEKTDEQGNKVVFDQFTDKELRYRRRYVDLWAHDGVLEVFEKRSKVLSSMRRYLAEHADRLGG